MASYRKSITKAKSLRWQAVWQEPGPNGRPQRRTKNFESRAEARGHAQRMEIEVEQKGVGDPQKHSFARYIARWLATLEERGELSPTTLVAYREHAARACKLIGHIPLEKLSPADLDACYGALLREGGRTKKAKADGSYDTRPLSPRSVLHVHRVVHCALEQARKWKLIRENPARDATPPAAGRNTPKAFATEEVGRLLDAAPDRETYTVLSTLLVTGVRRSELLGTALDAIDFEKGTITIKRVVLDVGHVTTLREATKSESSTRTLSIPPQLVELLREQRARVLEAALKWGKGYRTEPRFLFCRPDGEPLSPAALTTRLRKLMRSAGISGRPPAHGWRHTAATLLIDSGANIKTVQTRLGHATAAFTMQTYVHPIDARDEAAGEHLATLLRP